MALPPGMRLGPSEIVALLGTGGRGEVYHARDTKLRRDVALKILPESFARDPDRLARFTREARVLATLNHPHIASIYGFEESGEVRALVLELIEGPTLADRLAAGAIPVREALAIAQQIADALEAAHERGIIHRDLKPANIILKGAWGPTPTRLKTAASSVDSPPRVSDEIVVKVLDFGLAKALADDTMPDASMSPTMTAMASRAGVIVGTAAYMSPEQAQGKTVDKRADIWAFGCMLFEMLTGRQAFAGETMTDIIVALMTKEPDWTALPDETPAGVRKLLRRCLEKDPKRRLRDIGDAQIEMDEVIDGRLTAATEAATRRWTEVIAWTITAVASVIAVAALLWSTMRSSTVSTQPTHLTVSLPADAAIATDTDRPAIALSPDGSRLVYVADRHGKRVLYARRLDDADVKPMPGTEGASGPFFSPDGQWVGFFVGSAMKKVPYEGGAPVTFSESTPVTRGASWGTDDSIVFTSNPNGSFLRQPAGGGQWTELVPDPDPKTAERSHSWPELLPGARAALFALDVGGSFDTARVAVMNLDTKQKKVLVNGGTNPRYSSSEHVLYARAGSLFVAPFDAQHLELRGNAVKLVDGLMMESDGAANFAISQNGTLAYVAGPVESSERTLVWVDRTGTAQPLSGRAAAFKFPALAPDGRRLAVTIADGSNTDIWVLDAERGTLTRVTVHPDEDFGPIWSPDGRRIAFASEMLGGGPNLAWAAADGSGAPEILLPGPRGPRDWNDPSSWSPDGRMLAVDAYRPGTTEDIWTLSIADRKLTPLVRTEFHEHRAVFSPDGRWLAYVSDESGRDEVYVRPYPRAGEKVQLSNDGGDEPAWAHSGRELFYRNGDKMMAVAFSGQSDVKAAPPRNLFEQRFDQADVWGPRNYDVAADGRFIMVKRKNDVSPTEIHVILNWPEQLKRRSQ